MFSVLRIRTQLLGTRSNGQALTVPTEAQVLPIPPDSSCRMKKKTVRTTSGGFTSQRSADRAVKRGVARWQQDGRLQMIETDHRYCCERVAIALISLPAVVLMVDVQDSGMSICPWIGYRMETTGHGKATHERSIAA
jgi:hypothetical protein